MFLAKEPAYEDEIEKALSIMLLGTILHHEYHASIYRILLNSLLVYLLRPNLMNFFGRIIIKHSFGFAQLAEVYNNVQYNNKVRWL